MVAHVDNRTLCFVVDDRNKSTPARGRLFDAPISENVVPENGAQLLHTINLYNVCLQTSEGQGGRQRNAAWQCRRNNVLGTERIVD